MAHIFYEKNEIPIPSDGKINHYDGYVSIYFKDGLGHRRRQVIGKAASESTMYPNDRYKEIFPERWTLYYGCQELDPIEMHVGLYALTLGIGCKSGLYPMVQSAFGPDCGNGIMDYAMYSIMEETTQPGRPFTDAMQDRMLFSRSSRYDGWLERLFAESMTPASIQAFRLQWIESCARQGIQKVWLCIDGFTNDGERPDCTLCDEQAASHSHQGRALTNIWAVTPGTGIPVTWSVATGPLHASRALDEITRLLGSSNIHIEGVILDGTLPSEEILKLLKSNGKKYLVRLPKHSTVFKEMMGRHAETIRGKLSYLISTDAIFGITDQCKPFSTCQEDVCAALFFDAPGKSEQALNLLQKVMGACHRMNRQCSECSPQIQISSDIQPYLQLVRGKTGSTEITLHQTALQAAIDSLGYDAIISSEALSAGQIYALYRIRDIFDAQVAVAKAQIGSDAPLFQTDTAIQCLLTIAFIAGRIQTEIVRACERLDLNADRMLRQTQEVTARLMPNKLYQAVHRFPDAFTSLLAEFGLSEGHLDAFAQELNELKEAPVQPQVRTVPSLEPKPRAKPGPKPKTKLPEKANAPTHKPGRPKGSKNKATLQREKLMANQPAQEKRRPGRPKGAKNKKTLEQEAALARQDQEPAPGESRDISPNVPETTD